jgi:hypothetical protein
MIQRALPVILVGFLLSAGHAFAMQGESDRQIRAVIHDLIAVRGEMQQRLDEILKTYPDAEFDLLYSTGDLTSEEGIANARARLEQYVAKVGALHELGSDYRLSRERRMLDSDLDEPLLTRLRDAFAANETSVAREQDLWMEVQQSIIAATVRMLNFGERNLGEIKLDHGRPAFARIELHTEFESLQAEFEAAGKRTLESAPNTLPGEDRILNLLKAELTRCSGCVADSPSFSGMAWVRLEGDFRSPHDGDEFPATAWAHVVQLERNGDFSILQCLLLKGHDRITISVGDPHTTFLGEWRENPQGYVAEYVKVDEKIRVLDSTLAPFGRRYSDRVSMDGDSLMVGSERFMRMPAFPQPQYDDWITRARSAFAGKVQRLLDDQ